MTVKGVIAVTLRYFTRFGKPSGPGGIHALSARPTGSLQCFDTVGLVI